MVFLSDISLSTEAIAVIGVLMGGLCSAVVVVFKLLMATKERQLADMQSQRDSYKGIANESVRTMEDLANRVRTEQGKPAFTAIAAVVPEHSSPPSEAQKQAAELQTLRARIVAATLNINSETKR